MGLNKKPRLVMIGSYMQDLMSKSPKLPMPGETVRGGPFFMGPGGKGSNQAIAAAKLGASVDLVASIGDDSFGDLASESLKKHGVSLEFVRRQQDISTGIALIIVDDKSGENIIVVAPGANNHLSTNDVDNALSNIKEADCVVMQLEIPLDIVEYSAKLAYKSGVRVILDPAPACHLSTELLSHVNILTPNETEASIISGVEVIDLKSAKKAGHILCARGPEAVVITLGKEGVLVVTEEETFIVEAFSVNPVDTTGAGDAFNGALAVALGEGQELKAACRFAAASAALAVTKVGAAVASPTRLELDEFIKNHS